MTEERDQIGGAMEEALVDVLVSKIEGLQKELKGRKPLMDEVRLAEFETLARPLISFLCENFHPHVTVIITPTNAELLEGAGSTGKILDYLRD